MIASMSLTPPPRLTMLAQCWLPRAINSDFLAAREHNRFELRRNWKQSYRGFCRPQLASRFPATITKSSSVDAALFAAHIQQLHLTSHDIA